MAKRIVLFGATGSQGGSIAAELLKHGDKYTVLAITRNAESDAAKSLAKAGAQIVVADMYDPTSLEKAVRDANAIFAVTDFIGAGSIEKEIKQGTNIVDAALSTLDTLELFVWSNLPDARTQKIPFQNVIHFNSKNDIAKYIRSTPLAAITTEVILGPYYHNLIKAPPVYGPQKLSDGSWELMLPVHAETKIPFTSVDDLGKLFEVLLEDPKKFHAKKISVVCQKLTPAELLQSWNKAVGLEATFHELSTEDYKARLLTVYQFPEHLALTLAENLSVYRDDPEAWVEGTDFTILDLVPNLKTWDQYVQEEDWSVFFKSVRGSS